MAGNSTLLRADVPTRGPGKVFPCPCGGSFVSTLDTRPADERVRRRRECPKCGARCTTYEEVDEDTVTGPAALPAVLRDALLERIDVALAGGGS